MVEEDGPASNPLKGGSTFWQRDDDRGRDASYLAPPPAQISTGPIRTYGSRFGAIVLR